MTFPPSYNPYDFANPVTNRDLFSGRESELADIKYYLDFAASAPRPISLALIGNRASGKTSLLNIAAQEADQRGFCTVRIDLDESDVANSLCFFAKFLHAILFKAFSQDGFNGLSGGTYDAYLDLITTFAVPSDKTFLPFLFPIQYAKASAGNQTSAALLDEGIKFDMDVVSRELKTPIVILMDECDVLSLNRPILQKLRNILMQTGSYMLILSATPQLFPLLNDVFSPIVRQLKTIKVQDFDDLNDTIQCIEGPIRIMDLDPGKVFDPSIYREIHDLSGGRPYEINLICHVLFRRFQQQPGRALSLSAAALEDIRSELDKSQELSHRRILQEIKGLSTFELGALRFLCRSNGNLTFRQLSTIEGIFYGDSRWTLQDLEQISADLRSKQIVGTDDQDHMVFLGDEFERIYAKYFAKKRGINLHIEDRLPKECWMSYEVEFFRNHGVPFRRLLRKGREIKVEDIVNIATQVGKPDSGDVLSEYHWLASDLLWVLSLYHSADYVEFLQVRVKFAWLSNESLLYLKGPPNIDITNTAKELCQKVETAVKEQGGKLTWSLFQIPVPPKDKLVEAVLGSQESRVRGRAALVHYRTAVRQYANRKDKRAAAWHADLARRFAYEHSFTSAELNNLGYIVWSNGETKVARDLFNAAIEAAGDSVGIDYILPRYNLGVVQLIRQGVSSANDLIVEASTAAGELSEGEVRIACIMVPQVSDEGIALNEEWEPDLLDALQRTSAIIADLPGANN